MRGGKTLKVTFCNVLGVALVWFLFQSNGLTQACMSAAATSTNPWVDEENFAWILTQDSQNNITGTMRVPPAVGCRVLTWGVAGVFQGNGQFRARATNPDPDDPACVLWLEHVGTIHRPGCHYGDGTWSNSAGRTGNWNWSKSCEIPTSEITRSVGWADADGLPTEHNWLQELQPSTINFGGRRVREVNPGGGGPDTCHFPGSIFDPFTSVTRVTPWEVGEALENMWGYDRIGWNPNAVTYYRNQTITIPCGTQFPQQMQTDCRGLGGTTAWTDYRRNLLRADMDWTHVTSVRDGNQVSRQWP